MLAAVLGVGYLLHLATILELVIQIVTGVIVYLLLSWVTKAKPFLLCLEMVKNVKRKTADKQS